MNSRREELQDRAIAMIEKTISVNSSNSSLSYIPWPSPPAEEVYHGLTGDFVHAIEPQSEADPMALLVQFLVAFGNVIGRKPYFQVEATRHYPNLFVVLVGPTSKGRKGTALNHVLRLFESVDLEWAKTRRQSGLSSGEGLINAVKDDSPDSPGINDKRLLVVQEEFSSVLKVLRREGNTLSGVMRQAWDSGELQTMTRHDPLRASGVHVSIIGHIGRDELRRHLTETEMANGFGNRFLWICARRSKQLPHGGDSVNLSPFVERLQRAITFAQKVERMTFDPEAKVIWEKVYGELSEGLPGLFGSITNRAEAQVVRIACIYGLLNCSPIISKEHLMASLALWEYCEASCKFIFGSAIGDPSVDSLFTEMKNHPEGMTRTEISNFFGRNKETRELDRILSMLEEYDLVEKNTRKTEGRDEGQWVCRSTK